MTTQPVPGTDPGWYPHPTMAKTQRYWDGQAWTDDIAPGRGARAHNPRDKAALQSDWHLGIGAAILLPVVGLICGLFLLRRDLSKGVAVIALSAVCFAIYYVVVLALTA